MEVVMKEKLLTFKDLDCGDVFYYNNDPTTLFLKGILYGRSIIINLTTGETSDAVGYFSCKVILVKGAFIEE